MTITYVMCERCIMYDGKHNCEELTAFLVRQFRKWKRHRSHAEMVQAQLLMFLNTNTKQCQTFGSSMQACNSGCKQKNCCQSQLHFYMDLGSRLKENND